MGTFYATGAVFFLWPVMLLTLIFEYGWCAVSLAAAFGIHTPKGTARAALRRHLPAVFITSLGSDAVLTAVLYVLYVLSAAYPAFSAALDSPFRGWAGTMAALLCIMLILADSVMKYILYLRIVLRRTVLEDAERLRACRILSVMTTPWLYLVPTQTAYALLGSVMMALGRLTPGELPSELPP